MGENFRVTTEGLVPSSHGKSIGIGMLLYFVTILLTFENFSFCLVLITILKLTKCIVKFKGRTLSFLEPEDPQDSV